MLLVIPTLNEERGILYVLEKAKKRDIKTIVIDGGSEDNTVRLVKGAGIKLINVPAGKGRAFRYLVNDLKDIIKNEDYLLMMDGDGTYDLNEFHKLAEFKNYDMVIGRRIPSGGSLSFFRLFGNKLLNLAFSMLYLRKIPDLLSGYRLINIDKLNTIELEYNDFELETELTARFLKKGYSIKWVPVSYERRMGNSKLKAITDGFKILRCMFRTRFK